VEEIVLLGKQDEGLGNLIRRSDFARKNARSGCARISLHPAVPSTLLTCTCGTGAGRTGRSPVFSGRDQGLGFCGTFLALAESSEMTLAQPGPATGAGVFSSNF